jgi:diguanylate cyclase (GGDEF)-like protein
LFAGAYRKHFSLASFEELTMIPLEDQHGPSGAVEIDSRFLAYNCGDILHSLGADHVIHYVSLSALEILISNIVRASDIVCRWGGDKIAIILPAIDHAGVVRAADKVRGAVEPLRFRARESAGRWVSVTTSIGVATAKTEPDCVATTPQNLLLAADRNLYRAKRDGQNRMAAALVRWSINAEGECKTRL